MLRMHNGTSSSELYRRDAIAARRRRAASVGKREKGNAQWTRADCYCVESHAQRLSNIPSWDLLVMSQSVHKMPHAQGIAHKMHYLTSLLELRSPNPMHFSQRSFTISAAALADLASGEADLKHIQWLPTDTSNYTKTNGITTVAELFSTSELSAWPHDDRIAALAGVAAS